MTRTRLSIALLVLFAPAVALAYGGGGNGGGNGNGNGNGGVGGGMGGGHGSNSAGSVNAGGHGPGGWASGGAGMNGSGRAGNDKGPSAGGDFGNIDRAREDDREARAELKARAAARLAASSNAHGKAVSTEAHLAKSENDGDKVGQDVRVVAHDKSTLKIHSRMHTRVASTNAHTKATSTHTHPVNHGAAVSAEAHLAKSENDGDKVGEDVRVVAHDKSTLKTHTTMHTKVANAKTTTKTHPVNHGAAVSAEAHLARTENDSDTVGTDVSAVAKTNSQGHK